MWLKTGLGAARDEIGEIGPFCQNPPLIAPEVVDNLLEVGR